MVCRYDVTPGQPPLGQLPTLPGLHAAVCLLPFCTKRPEEPHRCTPPLPGLAVSVMFHLVTGKLGLPTTLTAVTHYGTVCFCVACEPPHKPFVVAFKDLVNCCVQLYGGSGCRVGFYHDKLHTWESL